MTNAYMVSESLLRQVLDALYTAESLTDKSSHHPKILSQANAVAAILASPPKAPVAWEMYKGGEKYAIKYERDNRGEFYTWHPLYRKDI